MKKIILLFIFGTFFSSGLFAQVTFYSSFNKGTFLTHSDNSLQILKDNKLSGYSGFSLASRFELFSLELQFEVGYLAASSNDLNYVLTLNDESSYEKKYRPDLKVSSYPFEILYIPYKNDWFLIGVGPSIVFTNRELSLNYNESDKFIDKISATGFGFSAFIQLLFKPFKDLKELDFFIGLKYSKINPASISKNGRKTGSYDIEFSQRHLSLGFTWKFENLFPKNEM